MSFISGIEEISGGGFEAISILGTTADDVFDFTGVVLTGITEINGGAGNDTITGSTGDDTINGGSGNDALFGGAGNDSFVIGGASGFDRFDGGSGSNSILAGGEGVRIGITSLANIQEISGNGFSNIRIATAAGAGAVYDFSAVGLSEIFAITVGAGGQTITGSAGDDNIVGGVNDGTLFGGEGNDIITGGGGRNMLDGGEGDDTFLVFLDAPDVYRGGNGYDVISGAKENAVIVLTTGSIARIEEINSGGFGNVTISGTAADDIVNLTGIVINDGEIAAINLAGGDDNFKGTRFGDTVNGGAGNDRILGAAGDDFITGGLGDDYLDAGAGFDTVNGGKGDDTIIAGFNDDTLFGDDGNDTFVVLSSNGQDVFDGGRGIDTIAAGTNAAKISFASLVSIEIISAAGFSNVTIVGTTSADTLDFTGIELVGIKGINPGGGNDTVIGSAGADTINGGTGDDTINGGDGDDIITGGIGLDVLTGGAGNDIFRDGIKNFAGDTITDFGPGDRLQFINIANPAAMTFAFANDTLTIDPDGAGVLKAFSFGLTGSFEANLFVASSDGTGGAFVDYAIG